MIDTIKTRLASDGFIKAAGSACVCQAVVRAGSDLVLIDGGQDRDGSAGRAQMIRAVELVGGEGGLRVPDSSASTQHRVLDRGFRALVVPDVAEAYGCGGDLRRPV
ncbi:hypothetical protein [Ponticoccus alexandrii]|uniref:Uncharacterized protein n=1 Tax=Ponticoccus alexandrii TaxID=1943633 RepID=A0ABX7FHU3_9RHOB|nr:hypothetical protein [Ponticoccus alexandrii]QRF69174.1 hypothetical protein GQA70_22810 [Ponticoccus alexandrii]